MQPISDYTAQAQGLSPDAFALQHPEPVLVYHGMTGPGTEEASSRFTTQAITRVSIRDSAAARAALPDQPATSFMHNVFPLIKRENSAYMERVSVGRVRTCDIQIPFARVSKFHAYFTWNDTKSIYYVVDAGATNGTFVGGAPLIPNVPTAVASNSMLLFGPYMFMFLLPPDLQALTLSMAAGA